jgi:hypothetical protein
MATTARVTVTLPADLVQEIDRLEKNRSKFVLEGVRREVHRRRREALRRSLRSPHPENVQLAEEGFGAWVDTLPKEDATDLVNMKAGTPVRWVPGRGWAKAGK